MSIPSFRSGGDWGTEILSKRLYSWKWQNWELKCLEAKLLMTKNLGF